MSKKKKIIANLENYTDDVSIDSIIEDEDNIELKEQYEEDNIESVEEFKDWKIETCKVIFIKDKSLVIDFKGYGINIKTHGLIDKDLICDYVDVKYIGEMGEDIFEYHLIF